MASTLKEYQMINCKFLEFLHGLKYATPETVQLLQVNVSQRIFFCRF